MPPPVPTDVFANPDSRHAQVQPSCTCTAQAPVRACCHRSHALPRLLPLRAWLYDVPGLSLVMEITDVAVMIGAAVSGGGGGGGG